VHEVRVRVLDGEAGRLEFDPPVVVIERHARSVCHQEHW